MANIAKRFSALTAIGLALVLGGCDSRDVKLSESVMAANDAAQRAYAAQQAAEHAASVLTGNAPAAAAPEPEPSETAEADPADQADNGDDVVPLDDATGTSVELDDNGNPVPNTLPPPPPAPAPVPNT